MIGPCHKNHSFDDNFYFLKEIQVWSSLSEASILFQINFFWVSRKITPLHLLQTFIHSIAHCFQNADSRSCCHWCWGSWTLKLPLYHKRKICLWTNTQFSLDLYSMLNWFPKTQTKHTLELQNNCMVLAEMREPNTIHSCLHFSSSSKCGFQKLFFLRRRTKKCDLLRRCSFQVVDLEKVGCPNVTDFFVSINNFC